MGVYVGLDASLDAVAIRVGMALLALVWRPVRRRNGSADILLTRASPSFAWRAGMSKRR